GSGRGPRRLVAALAPSTLTRSRAVLAALVAVVLVVGVAAAAIRNGSDERVSVPPVTTGSTTLTSTTVTPASAAAIDATVHELQAFVEGQRGLKYKAPVKVTLLDAAAFRA